jgi:hypothetical protein
MRIQSKKERIKKLTELIEYGEKNEFSKDLLSNYRRQLEELKK